MAANSDLPVPPRQYTAELQQVSWARATASIKSMYAVVRAGSRKILELDDPNPQAAGERFAWVWEKTRQMKIAALKKKIEKQKAKEWKQAQ